MQSKCNPEVTVKLGSRKYRSHEISSQPIEKNQVIHLTLSAIAWGLLWIRGATG